MVSCKRGTHLSKKCGFVQEGDTFIEKMWFRARGAHIYRTSMVSCKRGTHFLNKTVSCKRGTHLSQKNYGVVQEGAHLSNKFSPPIILSPPHGRSKDGSTFRNATHLKAVCLKWLVATAKTGQTKPLASTSTDCRWRLQVTAKSAHLKATSQSSASTHGGDCQCTKQTGRLGLWKEPPCNCSPPMGNLINWR